MKGAAFLSGSAATLADVVDVAPLPTLADVVDETLGDGLQTGSRALPLVRRDGRRRRRRPVDKARGVAVSRLWQRARGRDS